MNKGQSAARGEVVSPAAEPAWLLELAFPEQGVVEGEGGLRPGPVGSEDRGRSEWENSRACSEFEPNRGHGRQQVGVLGECSGKGLSPGSYVTVRGDGGTGSPLGRRRQRVVR